jgi:hypothetical protein
MATIGDAIIGAINTNWAVPTGGVKPTLANTEDVRFDYPDVTELVIALSYTLYTRVERVNDTYVDRFHTITLQAQTTDATNKEERLHEIVDEVDRIMNTNGVTGFTTVKIMKKDYTPSDRSRGIYAANLHIELIERNTAAATAAGSTTASTMTIDELTVNTWLKTPTVKDAAGTTVFSLASGVFTMQDDVAAKVAVIGKSRIGGDATYGDYAWFGHRDQSGAGFAVLQGAGGDSFFNTKTGTTGHITIAANDVLNWTAAAIKVIVPFHPNADKTTDMGTTGALRWDDIYADDFVNESPYMKFDSPLSELKKIKDKKDKDDKDKIDYDSLPDWVRMTEYKRDEDGNKTGEKDQLNKQGFSVNRMVVFLWQALQEALARIEVLEAT